MEATANMLGPDPPTWHVPFQRKAKESARKDHGTAAFQQHQVAPLPSLPPSLLHLHQPREPVDHKGNLLSQSWHILCLCLLYLFLEKLCKRSLFGNPGSSRGADSCLDSNFHTNRIQDTLDT
eukprot:Skav216889  [mRNA]  locus=scaffold1276:30915:32157:- [translate_table: standard]